MGFQFAEIEFTGAGHYLSTWRVGGAGSYAFVVSPCE
jgi:hypothetical protein